MMMKKAAAVILTAMMSMSLAACGSASGTGTSSETASESAVSSAVSSGEDIVLGGWEVNEGSMSIDDNADAKEAFEKAMKSQDGSQYEVIAYLGSQLVSGTNYSYLCRGTEAAEDGKVSYVVLNVYEDLDGNAEVQGVKDLLDPAGENEVGGWSFNEGKSSPDDNADVKAAFEKAVEGKKDAEYEPVAYIGSQVVSGTNYAVFCRKSTSGAGAGKQFCLVTVYEDPDGNASITDEQTVDPGVPGITGDAA